MSETTPRPAASGAKDQVARLLTLVPYLHARDSVRLDEAAVALGVSPHQLLKDLKVLLMCGLPGGYPDDLIDVDLDALEDPGGDGVIYSLDPGTGEVIWQFDCNPKDSEWILGGRGTRNNILATPVIYDNKVYIGVGQDPEHGEAPGHFYVIDATGTGDVTDTHKVWSRDGDDFYRTLSSAAIADGVLYISSLSGFLHALDVNTGEEFWTYDAFAAVWGSAFVVDSKVFLGDEDGDVVILRAGKEMELLAEINMGASVYSTPVVRDGVLYILTRNRIWAIQEGASSDPIQ